MSEDLNLHQIKALIKTFIMIETCRRKDEFKVNSLTAKFTYEAMDSWIDELVELGKNLLQHASAISILKGKLIVDHMDIDKAAKSIMFNSDLLKLNDLEKCGWDADTETWGDVGNKQD